MIAFVKNFAKKKCKICTIDFQQVIKKMQFFLNFLAEIFAYVK